MRILLLIDSLNSGGAQRQICMLALGLRESGNRVELLSYHPHDFYDYMLEGKVPIKRLPEHKRWQRPWKLRKAIRGYRPDVVISFLEASCLYAELASLPTKPFKLIVGERNLDLDVTGFFRLKTQMHRIADAVVCNSYAQTEMIAKHAPWLKDKLHTIPNAIDARRFKPVSRMAYLSRNPGKLRFLTVGRYAPQKNGELLLNAFAGFLKATGFDSKLDWYGNRFFVDGEPTRRSSECLKLKLLADKLGIAERVSLNDAVVDVESLYHQYDAFVLASKHEGCPNVLVEAMACGLPVIASDISDNARIVNDSVSGFLFSVERESHLRGSFERLCNLSTTERYEMGSRGNLRVIELFDLGNCRDRFQALCEEGNST
ncbi:MAG: glycosyltransferase [Opitutales bacterium]|nr:glycosyltransferase [Opitutales bacterium]